MIPISIIIVDDHTIMRDGIRTYLETYTDFNILAEAENGLQAVALAETLRPDVAVLDWAMPAMNGQEATRQIVNRFPSTKVVILSLYDQVENVRNATAAGASGYVLKDDIVKHLASAITAAAAGKMYFSPGLPGSAANGQSRPVEGR